MAQEKQFNISDDDDIITHGMKASSRPEIVKGDFVRMNSGFVGQVLDNQKRSKTRMVHVFGVAEESGSVYASDMEKISENEFENEKSKLYKQYDVPHYRQWSTAEMDKQESKARQKNKLNEMS